MKKIRVGVAGYGTIGQRLADGVALQESRAHKAGHGRRVPRQAQGAHALAVGLQLQAGSKAVFRGLRG